MGRKPGYASTVCVMQLTAATIGERQTKSQEQAELKEQWRTAISR